MSGHKWQHSRLTLVEPPLPNSPLQFIFAYNSAWIFCKDPGVLMGVVGLSLKKKKEELYIFLKASAQEIKIFPTNLRKKTFPPMYAFLSVLFFFKKGKDTRGVRCVSCCKCSGEAVLSIFCFIVFCFGSLAHHALLSFSFVCVASLGTVFTSAGAVLASVAWTAGFSSTGVFLLEVNKTLPVKERSTALP